ncbi:MAG: PDZ domain-containing protein [Lachnospiraceae bacterium]|nr:PDZ domain-containing protein [Lachnospiraceae bacterium]
MSERTDFDENKKSEDNDNFDEQQFITEKIVNKRKKRWLRRLITFVFVIFCAVIFGLVARYVFLVSGGAMADILGIEIPVYRDTVYIYKEKTPTPTPRPTSTPVVPKNTPTPTVTATPKIVATPTNVLSETPGIQPSPEVTATVTPEVTVTPSPIVTQDPNVTPSPEITITPDPEDKLAVVVGEVGDEDPDVEKPVYSYSKFMEEVMQVTEIVNGCIASVDGVSSGISFLGDVYEIRTNTTGLVVAQDGVDVLILTDYASLEDSETIEVTFNNSEKTYAGKLYNYDKDLGLAIVGVSVSSLEEEMFQSMQYAVLCKAEDIENGCPVFELGRANGYPDSLSFGIVSSRGNRYEVKDAEITYFTSNWQNYAGASGFVFNMDGYVLGILTHAIRANEEDTIPCFVTLCTLEDEINILLNGKKLLYFGILANAIPGVIRENGGVEYGIYLNQVMAASPAYVAGLRVGDVITSINGEKVSSMQDFMNVLSSSEATQALNVTYLRGYAGGSKEMSAYVILQSK